MLEYTSKKYANNIFQDGIECLLKASSMKNPEAMYVIVTLLENGVISVKKGYNTMDEIKNF